MCHICMLVLRAHSIKSHTHTADIQMQTKSTCTHCILYQAVKAARYFTTASQLHNPQIKPYSRTLLNCDISLFVNVKCTQINVSIHLGFRLLTFRLFVFMCILACVLSGPDNLKRAFADCGAVCLVCVY